MHLFKLEKRNRPLIAVIFGLFIMAATPLPALAARTPTYTGTVTGTAAGSTQINVTATYTSGASCGSGGESTPTFEVQWDISPADWSGYGTSGALTDAVAGSPFDYSITTGLTPGQTYDIRVIYTDGNGVNACTTPTSVTVNGNSVTLPNNGLTVGTNSAVVDSSTQITVTASFTGDANGNSTTEVQYNTSDSWPGTTKCATITGGSPRTCVVDGLQAGTQYWFRIYHTDSGDTITGTNPQVIGPYTTLAGGKIFCGSCHGAVSKSTAYEAPGLPLDPDACTNMGRGLHGTHNNYSSATFRPSGGMRGNCAYCHTATTDKAPTATHNNSYLNITGYNSGGVNSTGLRVSANTCTNACHRNRAATATWGNYTSSAIILNCRSCHDDVQDKTGLTGKHEKHLLSNVTTPGGYGPMNDAANAGCANCHPDNRNDTSAFFTSPKKDDGSKKVYPHASDGTNVAADNAMLQNNISAASKAGLNTTCTNACHARVAVTWGQTITWSEGDCNICHYYAASPLDTDNTGTGALSNGHNAHFKISLTCTECHPNNSDTSHVSRLPAQGYNARVIRSGMTWNRSTGKCSNTGSFCHLSGDTPAWGATGNGCGICHYYPNAPGRDWTATGNGHLARSDENQSHMKASGFNYQTDTFSAVIADVNKCGLCHRSVTHRNGSGFAHLSSAAGYQYCGTDIIVTVTTPGVLTTCSNVKCHSGRTTPNWWE